MANPCRWLRNNQPRKILIKKDVFMKRFLVLAIPIFLFGFIAGNAFWYLASPLWIDREVSETLPAELMLTPVASGTFIDADSAHKGKGTASLLRTGTRCGAAAFDRFSSHQWTGS